MVVKRYTWIPLRLVFGFSSAMVFMVAERWLTGAASSVTKSRVFTVYMVINKGSFGAGQLLLLLGDPSGDRLFMLTAILFELYLVPIARGSKGAPCRFLSAVCRTNTIDAASSSVSRSLLRSPARP